ncbi:p-benzoquinone reductase [Ferrovum sp. JA12]|uniref:flavodoxin family protein n=1 Tax=Ferrovum sp. JA12 TaxID=1356299 RepID=UPI0007029A97|nr:flavodoxin family protein [Ferrovum sp. JA12]KRH78343.1 p-benzoquinone reductase [Ferrovum sp. JA12]
MSKVVVVYHSGYGHTKKQAEALAQGAQATLIAIDAEGNISEQEWQLLDEAKAIVFGSPTYMGNVSWQFKKFADATSKIWFTQKWKNKFFGGFTNSATMNGDKHSTLHYFITLAMQHSGIWVGTGLMASNAKSAHRDDVNFVGSFAGAMMQTPSDASSYEVNQGDLKTAELYGQRILECVKG